VGPESLPVYLEMGYTLLNLGEEARVPLEGFSLEGSARKDIRHPHTRCVRDGHSFELVPSERVPELLPVLRGISDAWLESKRTREKGFAMGSFSEEYVRRFPVGLVRRNGQEVAFATLWRTDEKEELSIDLMRHSEGAGPGVMEYLFAELMLWGSGQGYRWFNLGVAPLSGIEDHELAPLWNRVTNLIYRYGGYFYNFQGLRFFKAKFGPVWEPRYIAAPGGIAVPRVVVSIAALVAGGVRGVVAR
jgi:phosphatidylglycerol lysyltransferase